MKNKKIYQTPYAEAMEITASEILTASPEEDTVVDDFGDPV